ncbi:MAG TPA: helix-turn-helix domain-containing protein [Ktedonobacteraceae bacterium]|nr:helix-turn-helix domain-containing protein [Ktedonobacteraceae bacterium]
MPKLSDRELRRLIKGGETSSVEFKAASPRPDEMAQRLCGMANAQGGFIIIGIEDASLQILGVPDRRMALTKDVILRACRQIQPVLLLDPPEPETYTLDGRQLVVASVPPNNGPLYQASGVCWVRRGTNTLPLSVPEMLEIASDRGLTDWEEQPARKAFMDDIDPKKVERYLSYRSSRSRETGRFGSLEEVLLGLDCATTTNKGEIVPTNAGVLFFGRDPQRHIPQSEVVCVLYGDELGIGGYIDRKIITGTLQELIDEIEVFLKKHIMVGAKIEGWKRVDYPDYPIEALREAVVNAVIHRDYTRRGESIRVFYYSDRVEIHNPGLLLPGITIEQLEQGEAPSRLRNQVLANLLRDVPGYMERLGSGVKLMIRETKQMGLPPPKFREMSEVIVTFRKAPISTASQPEDVLPKEQNVQPTLFGDLPVGSGTTVSGREEQREQEHRKILAMRYVQERGSITNREYRELTGVSENTALRDLEELVEKGVLKITGKTRGRQYRLP